MKSLGCVVEVGPEEPDVSMVTLSKKKKKWRKVKRLHFKRVFIKNFSMKSTKKSKFTVHFDICSTISNVRIPVSKVTSVFDALIFNSVVMLLDRSLLTM